MPLKVYKRGEVYHYRGKVAGRKLRGSTGTFNKEIAEQIANRIEAREWKRDFHGPEAVLRFSDAAVAYLKAGKPSRFIDKLLDYWKETLIKDITPGAIKQAAIDIYPKAGPATRNRQAIVPMVAIINHCAELEQCPPIRVRRFKVETKERPAVTWQWIVEFSRHAPPHMAALAKFMFLTGARISEALAVQWKDIDLQNRTVLIKQTKVGAERRAHLPPELFITIANLPRETSPFQYKTRGAVLTTWLRTCERAGLPRRNLHACRHGFATAMLHAGYDAVTVAKRGGWKTPRHVFETYGHAVEDITITDRLTGNEMNETAASRGTAVVTVPWKVV